MKAKIDLSNDKGYGQGSQQASQTFQATSQPTAQITHASSQPTAQTTQATSQQTAQTTQATSQPTAQTTQATSQQTAQRTQASCQPTAQTTLVASQQTAQTTPATSQPTAQNTQATIQQTPQTTQEISQPAAGSSETAAFQIDENDIPHYDNAVSFVKLAVIFRTNIRKDIIEIFSQPDILMCHLDLVVYDERGEVENGKGKGALLDVFTAFWQEFFMGYAVGSTEEIPYVRHDLQKPQWELIARVLVYGYLYRKYFPLSLSKSFVMSCLFGEQAIEPEDLMQSLRDFITHEDREVLNMCLSEEFDPNDEDALQFLSSFKCFRVPTKETIHKIVQELSHQELIQKPRYILNCWSPLVAHLKSDPSFKSKEGIMELYDAKQPTPKKVIKLFKAEPSSEQEHHSFEHLKRFVKSLEGKSLQRFLHFCTGSDVITCQSIEVQFSRDDGFARRPVVHTCGPMLQLPCTYESYPELAEEFTMMKEGAAWPFDLV